MKCTSRQGFQPVSSSLSKHPLLLASHSVNGNFSINENTSQCLLGQIKESEDTSEMAQRVRALVTKPGALSSVLETHKLSSDPTVCL